MQDSVINGRPAADPYNLGPGWVSLRLVDCFRLSAAISSTTPACTVTAQAAMTGAYTVMLYLGLGTGIGTAFIFDG